MDASTYLSHKSVNNLFGVEYFLSITEKIIKYEIVLQPYLHNARMNQNVHPGKRTLVQQIGYGAVIEYTH